MKFSIFITIALIASITNLFAQNNQPQVDIKVDKEYDDNGNIIRYDSTYTYFYSSDDLSGLDSGFINKKFAEFGLSGNPFEGSDFLAPLSFENFFNNDNFFSEDPFFEHFNKMHEQLMGKMLEGMEKNEKQNPPADQQQENKKEKIIFDESDTYTF